jgi:hypothetical protein
MCGPQANASHNIGIATNSRNLSFIGLVKQHQQSIRLSKLIRTETHCNFRKDLFHLALLLEEDIQHTINLQNIYPSTLPTTQSTSANIDSIIEFYALPELPLQQIKYSC